MDIFVYCDAERLAPDLPIPVIRIIRQTTNPGMAKNVERNIENVAGNICDIITNKNWKDVTKTRYVHHTSNHAFVRVDANDDKIPRADVRKINFNKYNLVAISDYNKGFLTEDDIAYICKKHKNVFIDTKKKLGKWASRARFIKINNYEYEHSPKEILNLFKNKIICTKGSGGAVYGDKIFPVEKIEIKDSSGAGDSFFAALIVKYLEDQNIEESIKFANICASQVVKERGVTVIKKH